MGAMSYPSSTSSIDFADLVPSSSESGQTSVTSSYQDPDTHGLLSKSVPSSPPLSPIAPQPSDLLRSEETSLNSTVLRLNAPVVVSFNKGNRLFKLRYFQVEVLRDHRGALSQIVLTDSHGIFIHRFVKSANPIPHVEQAVTSSSRSLLVVSFLENQSVTVAQVHFAAQPHYAFESWEDFIHFQEAIFEQRVLFMAGMAEAKSKGRGEECISQNLRVVQAKTGKKTMVFFPNSQRGEGKRYVFIPLDNVEGMTQGKKGGRPVTLRLRSAGELLSQLKTLQIDFLDSDDQMAFWSILIQSVGVYGS